MEALRTVPSAAAPHALSVGSMLAEEITINPATLLPSFLEFKFLQLTSESVRSSLKFSISALGRRLFIYHQSGTSNFVVANLVAMLRDYSSELCALITYILEKRNLTLHSATGTEHYMYGMKRSKVVSTPGGTSNVEELTKKDKIRSALVVALSPYVKEKLDNMYQTASTVEINNGNLSKDSWIKLIEVAFLKVYPALRGIHEVALLAYQWAYLFGRSVYYSPDLHFLRIAVRRITLEELHLQAQKQEKDVTSNALSTDLSKRESYSPKIKLIVVLFAARFLFHVRRIMQNRRRQTVLSAPVTNENASTKIDGDSLCSSIFPAPLPPPNANLQVFPAGFCPICNQIRVNPSASPSGYVYCYKCLVIYVRDHDGRCPLNYICHENQIFRLSV